MKHEKFMTKEEYYEEDVVPTLPIDFDEYNPEKIVVWDKYVEIGEEKTDMERAIKNATFPYLVESEKGQGKTLLVHTICKENNIALVTMPLGSGTTDKDLIGTKEINRNGTVFNLGLLPRGIEVANKYKHALIYGDEANAQDHDIQKVWNSICDGRRYIVANGKMYKLNEGCKLSIVWTVNPVTYAGVNTLTEDIRSRFIGRVWKYPTDEELKKVLNWEGFSVNDMFIQEPLLKLAQDIHALRSKGEVEYALSVRDLMQFLSYLKEIKTSNITKANITNALRNVFLIKYSDETERELIKVRMNDTFDVVV